MLMNTPQPQVSSLEITREQPIAAPVDIVFRTLLDQMGPRSESPDGTPFPMKLEPWPGGRWFRDLGNNSGHFWGHVQVIKPPTLLEICGPMFMSYPAISHLQYRLLPEGEGGQSTRLKLIHRAMGHITQEHRENVVEGWNDELKKIREIAERLAAAPHPGR